MSNIYAASTGGAELIPGYRHRLSGGPIGEWNQWGRLRTVLMGTWEYSRCPSFPGGRFPDTLDVVAPDMRAILEQNAGRLISEAAPELYAGLQAENAALRQIYCDNGIEVHSLRAPTEEEQEMTRWIASGIVQAFAAEAFWLLGRIIVENMWRTLPYHPSYKWTARDVVQPLIDACPAVRHHCPPFTKPTAEYGAGDYCYEGGDVVSLGDGNVLVGVERHSTNRRGADWLKRVLEDDGFKVTIVEPPDTGILHLASVLMAAIPGLAIAYRAAFPNGVLPEPLQGWDMIWIDEKEAKEMGTCNVMLDRKSMVIPAACPRIGDELARRGINPIPVDISLHAPCGGGIRCMTAVIYREID